MTPAGTVVAPEVFTDARWLETPGLGVYVHIPFCKHRCHYCDFNTYEGLTEIYESYVDSLCGQIRAAVGTNSPAATSVFFGGGTPTLLDPELLARVVAAVRDDIGIASDAEVTVEANPETLDDARATGLLEAGFNRISIGVQSTTAGVLGALGRTHSPERALQAVVCARRAGFDNINADLIFGSPWETPEQWRRSLADVVDVAPDHISAYALTVEEGTPLATLVRNGRVPDVDPDVQAERHAVADEYLASAGYRRYEVSNWARPGKACRHNLLYWSAGNYFGFGAGAHGHFDGRRYWNVRLPRDYMARVADAAAVEAGSEELAEDERAGEALMLGLRLAGGIDLTAFARRFGPTPLSRRAAVLAQLAKSGMVEHTGTTIRVRHGAALIANEAFCQVL